MINNDDLATIDKEIVELIILLNDFTSVTTLYSCAGFGEVADVIKNSRDYESISHDLINGYYEGYLFVQYNGSKLHWNTIHKAIKPFCFRLEKFNSSFKIGKIQFVYRVRGETHEIIRQKWARIFASLRKISK